MVSVRAQAMVDMECGYIEIELSAEFGHRMKQRNRIPAAGKGNRKLAPALRLMRLTRLLPQPFVQTRFQRLAKAGNDIRRLPVP